MLITTAFRDAALIRGEVLISMWIPKGAVLIRGWDLFQARRLLEETRYPPIFLVWTIRWNNYLRKNRRKNRNPYILSDFQVKLVLHLKNAILNTRFLLLHLFVCLFHWAPKNMLGIFSGIRWSQSEILEKEWQERLQTMPFLKFLRKEVVFLTLVPPVRYQKQIKLAESQKLLEMLQKIF